MTAPIRSLRLLPKPKSELDRLSGNKGEIFYDSTAKSLRIFDGALLGGTLLNASVTVKDTPPDSPTQGSLWFNSSTGAFYIYYQDGSSNQWIAPIVPAGLLGSGGSSSGSVLTGLAGKLAYYPANGDAVNDLTEVSWDSNELSITGTVTATGQKSKVRFHWDTLASLQSEVNATTYQGMLAYAADTARPYFAHGGAWVALARQSDLSSSNAFSTIAVAGQSSVLADQVGDTLTIIAGTNISITTDATNDSITINNSINLSNYVTTTSLTTTLGSYATTTSLNNYVTTTTFNTTLSSYATTAQLGNYATTASLASYTVWDTNAGTYDGVYSWTGKAIQYDGSVNILAGSTGTGQVGIYGSEGVNISAGGPGGPINIGVGTETITFSGGAISFNGVAALKGTIETLNTKTSATGTVDHDFSTGAIFYHSSISADFTANFTSVPITNNKTISVALVLTQGATAYMPTAVEIDSASQTILWQGGNVPSGTANGTDIVSFTLIRVIDAWTVIGSATSYS